MSAMDGWQRDEIVGCTDGLTEGKIEGWAWRPQSPEDRVVVQVLVDGVLLGEWTACLHRPDLQAAGIGDGRHAFEIPLDVSGVERAVAQVTVRAKGGAVLPKGAFEVPCGSLAGEAAARAALLAQVEPVFGKLTDGAADAPAPPAASADRPFQVMLYGGGTPAGAALRDAFAALLRPAVPVHDVRDLAEAEQRYADAASRGETCLMLSFAPVPETPLGQRFPVVPVIAWPFATLPDGAWSDDAREDWRFVLRHTGRAIATSAFAARVVRAAMGAWFPVAFIPPPLVAPPVPAVEAAAIGVAGTVWDSRAAAIGLGDHTPALPAGAAALANAVAARGEVARPPAAAPESAGEGEEVRGEKPGSLIDGARGLVRRLGLARRAPEAVQPPVAEAALPAAPPAVPVALDGIVFTAMVSVRDAGSHWQDLVLAFATAFASEPAATLVLRMTPGDPALWWWELHGLVRTLPAFACRIVVLDGGLDAEAVTALVGVTRFVVSADAGEATGGALLPFLAAGRPAIVPGHTAWLDYVSAESGFVVACEAVLCAWPRDPRRVLATLQYRVDFTALCGALRAALRAAHDPGRMAAMGEAAAAAVRAQAGEGVVAARLAAFLGLGKGWVTRAGWAPIRGAQPDAMLDL